MSSTVTIFNKNIAALVSNDYAGSPETGYPFERCYDDYDSVFWVEAATGTVTVIFSNNNVHAVGLLGVAQSLYDCTIEYSYSMGGPWNQAGSKSDGSYFEAIDPASQLYEIRFTFDEGAYAQGAAEMVIRGGTEFEVLPDPPVGHQSNDHWNKTVGASQRGVKLGPTKQTRHYRVIGAVAALLAFQDEMEDNYHKPVWVKDHLDKVFPAIIQPIQLTHIHTHLASIELELTEI